MFDRTTRTNPRSAPGIRYFLKNYLNIIEIVVTLLICHRYFNSHPHLSLFLVVQKITDSFENTKHQVKLFEMHCFTMFITALCVIFLKPSNWTTSWLLPIHFFLIYLEFASVHLRGGRACHSTYRNLEVARVRNVDPSFPDLLLDGVLARLSETKKEQAWDTIFPHSFSWRNGETLAEVCCRRWSSNCLLSSFF